MGFHSPMNPQHKWYVVAPGWVILIAGLDGALDKFKIGHPTPAVTGDNAKDATVGWQSKSNYMKKWLNDNDIDALDGPMDLAYGMWVLSIPLGAYMTGIYR